MVERFDFPRLIGRLHGLAEPPAGRGFNHHELADMLPAQLIPAAVLVGIVDRVEPTVLLTTRTEQLSTHAGQVSFPGGRIDADDPDAIAAALREAEEEIGLAAAHIEPLGFLDPFDTISAYRVLPLVARVAPGFSLRINPGEVAEAFEVPLSLFLDPHASRIDTIDFRGRQRQVVSYHFEGRRIWGATAAMLMNLRHRMER